jgi:hypothetical protein
MEKIFFWLQKVIAVIFFPRQGLLEEEPKKMLLQILRFGFSEEDFFSHLHVLEEEVISAAKANLFSQVCLRKMKCLKLLIMIVLFFFFFWFWRETNFAWEAAKLWQVFYLWI